MILGPQRHLLRHDDDRHEGGGGWGCALHEWVGASWITWSAGWRCATSLRSLRSSAAPRL